jgi:hypothetical protein
MKRGIPIPFAATFSKDYLDQLSCDLIVSPDGMTKPLFIFFLFTLLVCVIIPDVNPEDSLTRSDIL